MRDLTGSGLAYPVDLAYRNLLGHLLADEANFLHFTLTSLAYPAASLVANRLGLRLANPVGGAVVDRLGNLFANPTSYAGWNFLTDHSANTLGARNGLGFASRNPNSLADNSVRSGAANSRRATANPSAAAGAWVDLETTLSANALAVRATWDRDLLSLPVTATNSDFAGVRNLFRHNFANRSHDSLLNWLADVDHDGLRVVLGHASTDVNGDFLLVRLPNRATNRVVYHFGLTDRTTYSVVNRFVRGLSDRTTNGVFLRRVRYFSNGAVDIDHFLVVNRSANVPHAFDLLGFPNNSAASSHYRVTSAAAIATGIGSDWAAAVVVHSSAAVSPSRVSRHGSSNCHYRQQTTYHLHLCVSY